MIRNREKTEESKVKMKGWREREEKRREEIKRKEKRRL